MSRPRTLRISLSLNSKRNKVLFVPTYHASLIGILPIINYLKRNYDTDCKVILRNNNMLKEREICEKNNIEFREDDWESPTLGASGLGWEIRCNGMEICQYTYFQQIGGIECNPVSVEITYGLERLAMFIQKVNNVFDIFWNINKKEKKTIMYKDIYLESEKQFSKYNFELANTKYLFKNFEYAESECKELLNNNLPLPAYENCIKASHYFNILDARGVIGVVQRQSYILKIRTLVKSCCELYIKQEL